MPLEGLLKPKDCVIGSGTVWIRSSVSCDV
jgi:hypothetical protein